MKQTFTSFLATLISITAYAAFSSDTIHLNIKGLWIDNENQINNHAIYYGDTIRMTNTKNLVIELPNKENAIYYYNDDTTGCTTSFKIYANNKVGEATFYATVIMPDSSVFKTSTIHIQLDSSMLNEWWFSLALVFYLAILAFAAGYLIMINRKRGIEKLADLRADWTNKLHNDIGGDLSGVAFRIGTMKRKLAIPGASIEEDLSKVQILMANIQKKLRFVFDLIDPKKDTLPIMLDDLSSFATENARLKHIDFQMYNEINEGKSFKLDMNRSNKLYLVLKEAINNALKYSNANVIKLYLKQEEDQLEVEVEDDGIGFDLNTKELTKGSGLSNLKAYAKEGFMAVEISSKPHKGTKIKVTIPNL
jgi:hypothetical protein